jgi:hypothetical protein
MSDPEAYIAQLEIALRAHQNLAVAKRNAEAARKSVEFWQSNLDAALAVLVTQPIALPRSAFTIPKSETDHER